LGGGWEPRLAGKKASASFLKKEAKNFYGFGISPLETPNQNW
jgi:hypothetical protein